MPISSRHEHEFQFLKRVNRIVISECIHCDLRKCEMIKKFSKEQAETIDNFIKRIRRDS